MALRIKKTELLENNSMLNIQKLGPNLMDKKNYVVHYRNLQLSLSLGMKRKKYTTYSNSMKNIG